MLETTAVDDAPQTHHDQRKMRGGSIPVFEIRLEVGHVFDQGTSGDIRSAVERGPCTDPKA